MKSMRERPCSLLNFLGYDAVPDSHAVGGRKSGCRGGNGGGALDFQKLVENVRKQDGVTEERALLDGSSSQVSQLGSVSRTVRIGGKQALVLSAFLSCEAALWKAASPES